MQNRRALGLLLLIIGFALAYLGSIYLIVALPMWVVGALLFAKSYLD